MEEKKQKDAVGLTLQSTEDASNSGGDSTRSTYKSGVKYAGYLVVQENGTVKFYRKQKKVYANALVVTYQKDCITVQENESVLKCTLVMKKAQLTFSSLVSVVDKLVKTIITNSKL